MCACQHAVHSSVAASMLLSAAALRLYAVMCVAPCGMVHDPLAMRNLPGPLIDQMVGHELGGLSRTHSFRGHAKQKEASTSSGVACPISHCRQHPALCCMSLRRPGCTVQALPDPSVLSTTSALLQTLGAHDLQPYLRSHPYFHPYFHTHITYSYYIHTCSTHEPL